MIFIKNVLSISLGSSKRDHKVEINLYGENFIIERRGTDGDKEKARYLFNKYDGVYDAFGLGGIDLYIYSGHRRYMFRDAYNLIKNVKRTPVVDGSGLKRTLEKRVIEYIDDKLDLKLSKKRILIVSAMDRIGMMEVFERKGADLILGDLIFGLGLPFPIKKPKTLKRMAKIIAPIITKVPFEYIYPTGKKQNNSKNKKWLSRYYMKADIIAGDFHYIKRYMPENMKNKIIVTNTVTAENIKKIKKSGVKILITTTPELEGRSFGTNVMEAVFITMMNKAPDEVNFRDYVELLSKIDFKPRLIQFYNEKEDKKSS